MAPRKKNLVGMKFNKWTVLEPTTPSRHGDPRWVCRCDCGEKGIVAAGKLSSGSSKQCRKCMYKSNPALQNKYQIGETAGNWVLISRDNDCRYQGEFMCLNCGELKYLYISDQFLEPTLCPICNPKHED